jgi:ribonuclease P protein component
MENKFGRELKVKSKITIEKLFSKENKSFLVYPIKTIFYTSDQPILEPMFSQILISVPKRKFKKAVDRNRIKRLIREAFRVNKQYFEKETKIAFLYVANEILDLKTIEKAIVKSLVKIKSDE